MQSAAIFRPARPPPVPCQRAAVSRPRDKYNPLVLVTLQAHLAPTLSPKVDFVRPLMMLQVYVRYADDMLTKSTVYGASSNEQPPLAAYSGDGNATMPKSTCSCTLGHLEQFKY